MTAKADKGNSLVILPTEQYESKIQNFINENKFHKTDIDPTKTYQNQIRNTVKQSKLLIPSNSTWKYTNVNSSTPTIRGLIKTHKPDLPIRPVVNWKSTPAYKLSRTFTQKINELAPLPYAFKVEKLLTTNTRKPQSNPLTYLPHQPSQTCTLTSL
jgi:hypothetical protein